MYVIATAGHVDHGKSALVQALTGIDPDRLQEEKDRGLTIDLGFAWMMLPSGEEVSIVDVPGHERFIKNMLAGVGGVDLALLVIACDEGVMPQTREHLAILDLLGVGRGVVALSKSDLVDEEWLGLVREEARGLLVGTSLEGAPLVACSVRSGDGIEELRESLADALAQTERAVDRGRPRLPIDRSFTMSGFGTVVTGTLLDGSLKVGEEVEVVPSGQRARIRGLQNHRKKVKTALPGRRTAVNLAGVAVSDLTRGMQLTRPGGLELSSLADVRLRVLAGEKLRHGMRCVVHHYAAEVESRLSLLDSDRLSGEEGWGQLRLSSPLPLRRGDRVVLRAGGATLGGATVVEIKTRRHRRNHEPTLQRLASLMNGSGTAAVGILERIEPCTLGQYLKASEGRDGAEERLLEAVAAGRVVRAGDSYLTASRMALLEDRARSLVAGYHERHTLRAGMPREELREQLGLEPAATSAILEYLSASGKLKAGSTTVAVVGWSPAPSSAQKREIDAFVGALSVEPYAPALPEIEPELAAYVEASGSAVRVGDIFFAPEAYDEMVGRIVAAAAAGPISLAEVRDMFGTSRRYAQALLEHLDQLRVTRRVGDTRVLRDARPAPTLPP